MKSYLLEDVDYVHRDPTADRLAAFDCYWNDSFKDYRVANLAFPIYLRRERYEHTGGHGHCHHDFLALYIVRAGRGSRLIDGFAHSLARGDVFLMAPKTTHIWRAPVDLTIDAIYFQESLWDSLEWDVLRQLPELGAYFAPGSAGLAARGNTDHFGHLSPELHTRVEATLDEMRRELAEEHLPERLAARGRFFALLVQLARWRENNAFTTRPARGAGIAEVLAFCDKNFHRPLCNSQLAALMHFSETHFRQVFSREVGMSPGAYLRHLRLQNAQKLLVERKLPVKDVARLSGFSDSTQLGRAFKKAFGISPLDMRKNQKLPPKRFAVGLEDTGSSMEE